MREAARRVLGQRHFDVQLMGGMALHFGWIAEMKTGEGKTLVSTLPVVPQRPRGPGRARHHGERLPGQPRRRLDGPAAPLPRAHGRAGSAPTSTTPSEKRDAYDCDITYGTNNEFGFDYLRDNMARSAASTWSSAATYFAIVDEVDSILIDEARTPLIISGPATDSAKLYYQFAGIVRGPASATRDYEVDEEKRIVVPTEEGIAKVEEAARRREHLRPGSIELRAPAHPGAAGQGALPARQGLPRAEGEVKIVDEFTGRILEGRRWSEGLHQAVEAKERVQIKEENHTWATVTLQNYFRLYEKLSGMTGTAETEAAEFATPTTCPWCRSRPTAHGPHRPAPTSSTRPRTPSSTPSVDDIVERYEKGQPVLVGTISVEKSEKLSAAARASGASRTRCSTPSSTPGKPRS